MPLAWNDAHPDEPPIGVTVLDNFFREAPLWLKELGRRPEVDLMVHDVRGPLPDQMGDFAYIIHAAGIASPTYYRAHPIETMDANINGLRSLLDYARQRLEAGLDMEGFLFYSSSEIYGDPAPDAIPTPETYRGFVSCTGPRACYDESKRYGETLCVNFARQHGIPVTAARPFNNYGPGMKITDGRVIADFFRDALAGRDLRDALRRVPDAHLLLRLRRRSPATTVPCCGAVRARPTTSASTARRSRCSSSPRWSPGSPMTSWTTRSRWSGEKAPNGTTWWTTRTAAARTSPRRGRNCSTGRGWR